MELVTINQTGLATAANAPIEKPKMTNLDIFSNFFVNVVKKARTAKASKQSNKAKRIQLKKACLVTRICAVFAVLLRTYIP